MSKRISPAQRLQAEIDEVFAGGEDLAGAIEQVAVLGARLLLQAAIECRGDRLPGSRPLRTHRELRGRPRRNA